MVKYTIENKRKRIFSLKNGWGNDKRNKKFKKRTWKIAMKYLDRLKQEGLPDPSIIPCVPNFIDLCWQYKDKWSLLFTVDTKPYSGGYYGVNYMNKEEIMGNFPPEDFEVTISKIVNLYNNIKKSLKCSVLNKNGI